MSYVVICLWGRGALDAQMFWPFVLISRCFYTSVGDERYENLLSKAKQMEQELASMRVELFNLQGLKTQCEKVDTIYENVSYTLASQ